MNRKFLGWDKPVLELASAELIARAKSPGISLRHLAVVVPGQRAGRNLLAALTTLAEERGSALIPPTLLTAGRLPELFYESEASGISDLEAELLWIRTVQDNPALVAALLGNAPAPEGLSQLHALAKTLLGLRSELGALGESIPELINKKLQEYVVTSERWEALAELMAVFEGALAELGRTDTHLARAEALAKGRFTKYSAVILLGTLDLPPVAKRIIKASGAEFESWIHAPQSLAEGFDEFGSVAPQFWREFPLEIASQQIAVAPGAAEQAQQVALAIAQWSKRDTTLSPDDIVVAAPDPSVTPHVKEILTQCELPVRDGSGVPQSFTGPGSMLALVTAFLASGGMRELGSLVRHPEMLRWLSSRPELAAYRHDVISYLDRYQAETIPLRVVTADGRVVAPRGEGRTFGAVSAVLAALQLVGLLPARVTHPLQGWVPKVRELFRQLYGERALRRGLNEEKLELESLEVIDAELAAIEALPQEYGVSATFAEMLTFLTQRISSHSIEPNTFEAEIELIGWLELYFDSRPCVAVVGCNEGFLPESITADPFLPDDTRKQLGLTHNAVRYARDCAVLAAVLHSRESVQLVVGSRGAQGEVIAPSALLLSDPKARAERVLRFYKDGEDAAPLVIAAPTGAAPTALLPFEPKPLESPLERLSVTGISRYLECPYRFYLEFVERLGALRDDAQELDARAFGILGHAVLSSITPESALAREQDPRRLRAALEARLAELVAQRYGTELAPAVQIQVEQLRLRLAEFAVWQAQWAAQGWRVRHVEQSFEGRLETAHGVLKLSAKIDRIDEQPQSGELAVFDYKFQDLAKSAKSMHRSREEFHNLQLPLYRMVMEQNGLASPAKLGILALSGERKGKVDPSWLDLSDADFEEAKTLAHDTATKIQAGIFWPPAQLNAPFDAFKWICAVGTEDEDSPAEEEGAYE